MYELQQAEYERTRPLFAPLTHHLAIESILAGLSPGRVFVDNLEKPKTAVAWFKRRVFLAGNRSDTEVNKTLNRLFTNIYYPEMINAGLERSAFTMVYTPGWERVMDTVLAGKYPITGRRLYYRLDPTKGDYKAKLPKGFKLRSVDADLLADSQLTNLDYVTREMVSERPTVADFLAKSFGVCLTRKKKIVGWCMSEYNVDDRCELGVETDPDYRRRGLAQASVNAVIAEAARRGYTEVGWVCDADNAPSMALAQKIGFALAQADETFFAYFDPILNLGVNGNMQLHQRNYQEAVVWYQKAVTQGDAPIWLWWNHAVAWANLGSQSHTFSCLNQLVDAGFKDRDFLESSEHFRPYHRTKDWLMLISRLRN